MEPLDDPKLNEVLRTWRAPDAPSTLRGRLLAQRAAAPGDEATAPAHGRLAATAAAAGVNATAGFSGLLRWLLTGSIRIPVPLGLAAAVIAAVWIYVATADRPPSHAGEEAEPDPVVSLADFEPVERVEPRIVGAPR